MSRRSRPEVQMGLTFGGTPAASPASPPPAVAHFEAPPTPPEEESCPDVEDEELSLPDVEEEAPFEPSWVVFFGGHGPAGAPAIVEATDRARAEPKVARALHLHPGDCFAVPAEMSVKVVAAIRLEEHPRYDPPPVDVPILGLDHEGGVVDLRAETTSLDEQILQGLRLLVGAEYVMTVSTEQARLIASVTKRTIRDVFAERARLAAEPAPAGGAARPRTDSAGAEHDHPAKIAAEIAQDLAGALAIFNEIGDDLGGIPGAPLDLGDFLGLALKREIQTADERNAKMNTTLRELGIDPDKIVEEKEKAPAKHQRKIRGDRVREAVADGEVPAVAAGRRLLTERQRELLQHVGVEGDRLVFLPQERIEDWDLLRYALDLLGGTYQTSSKKRKGGWTFPPGIDPAEVLAKAKATGSVFDPKLLGFFATSDALADVVVRKACIQPGDRVLEPEAGQAALALAARRACPGARISCVEIVPAHRAILESHGFELIGDDFLALSPEGLEPFDVVVMNPPFDGHTDMEIRHVMHALRFLKPGGRLVAILPDGMLDRSSKLVTSFKELLEERAAVIEMNPDGAFAEVGTPTETITISLVKAAA